MGMEDELFNTLRHIRFSQSKNTKGINMNTLINKMLLNMELTMLRKLRSHIDTLIASTETNRPGSAWNTEQPFGSFFGVEPNDALNPFTILGVREDATREEVDKAYREKAAKAHPDIGGTHEEMVRINAAREAVYMFKGW